MKVKATSTGIPALAGADAFARLLAASMAKAPGLKLVKTDADAESRRMNDARKSG